MNREEMLLKLSSAPFSAEFVALPSEGALEVTIITSKGTSYYWDSLDDYEWDIYCFEKIEKTKWVNIKKKLNDNALCLKDIESTILSEPSFVQENEGIDLNVFFSDLKDLPDEMDYYFYCYYDTNNNQPHFFVNETELSDYLNSIWSVTTEWDSMDDKELEYYISIINFDGYEIPYSYVEE